MTGALGRLLTYPDDRLSARLDEALAGGAALPEPARAALMRFERQVRATGLHELEELYARTFDMNPACSLEIGWHLYGEQYERGAFLVTMRSQLRRFGLEETCELPDHLSQALAILARMDQAEGRRFAEERLVPALDKILAGLGEAPNAYRHLLTAVRASLPAPAAASAGA